jgi:hypothetical protein
VPTQLVNVQVMTPPPAGSGARPRQQAAKNPFMNNPFMKGPFSPARPKTSAQGRPQQQQQQQQWRPSGPIAPQQPQQQAPPPPPQQQSPPDCARVSCPVNTMCIGDPRTAGYSVMCAAPGEACGGFGNVQCKETKICVKDPRVNW